jgi:hypothetical protein
MNEGIEVPSLILSDYSGGKFCVLPASVLNFLRGDVVYSGNSGTEFGGHDTKLLKDGDVP